MSFFDSIQDTAFNVVKSIFGNEASWVPSNGGEAVTSNILYKDQTEKQGLSDADFQIEQYTMEYKRGDFEGLKKAVDSGENETIVIKIGTQSLQFFVRRVTTKYDGKTYIAHLNPPTEL